MKRDVDQLRRSAVGLGAAVMVTLALVLCPTLREPKEGLGSFLIKAVKIEIAFLFTLSLWPVIRKLPVIHFRIVFGSWPLPLPTTQEVVDRVLERKASFFLLNGIQVKRLRHTKFETLSDEELKRLSERLKTMLENLRIERASLWRARRLAERFGFQVPKQPRDHLKDPKHQWLKNELIGRQ